MHFVSQHSIKPPISEKHFFVKQLSVHHNDAKILKDLSFIVHKGSVLSVMGPNGGGKTTLFKTLAGLKSAHSGHWGWCENGENVPLHPGDWAYLPQRFQGDRAFPLRVHEVLSLSFPQLKDSDISKLLAIVKLEGYYNAKIQTLSEGQFQRLLFARLYAKPTPIVFLDEPFAGLDETIIDDLLHIIECWKKEGRIIVLSHHNRLRALTHFPDTLLLARDQYHFGRSTEVLTPTIWQSLHDSICQIECC